MGKNKVGEVMELPEYLKYKNNVLYFNDINLLELIKKEGDCLEVNTLDFIGQQITNLNNIFNNAIQKYGYQGKYEYFYATKANYQKRVVNEVLKYTKYLETSSRNDISIIEYLYKHKKINKECKIICNGFKDKEYFNKIISLKNEGLNIIPIIENEDELKYLIDMNTYFEVGIRVNVDFEYNKVHKINDCTRFGMYYENILNRLKQIKNSKLKVTILHFHMNHNIKDINKYIKVLSAIIKNKYIPLKKKIETIEYLDIGGGIPASYYNKFNYELLIDKVLKNIQSCCKKFNTKEPNIMSECGSYTVADTRFNIFKVQLKKKIRNNAYWYILNNSIANLIPDSWITHKSYLILPINLVNNKFVNVKLSSLTCDNADRYYFQEKKDYLQLPDYKNEDLYIGFFKTGCYEEILSGYNTVHHCLIEEPKKIIVNKKRINVIKEKQTDKEILSLLNYK